MTKDELNAIKARYYSISPKKMQEIYATSDAAYKLIQAIPLLMSYLSVLEAKARNNLSASIAEW